MAETGAVDGRKVVELVTYKEGSWSARPVDCADCGGMVLFIRKSSMRDKAQWPSLKEGSRVSIALQVSAGRAIVSDAILASSSSFGCGAAEEPEPEPGPPSNSSSPSSSAAAAASYDPLEYQPAHPDDRDGNPTKPGKGKGKAKGKGKDEGGAEGKAKDDGTHRCGNCNAPNAKRKCNGCGVERYCGKECQAVRAV